jgi:hypothetical protein
MRDRSPVAKPAPQTGRVLGSTPTGGRTGSHSTSFEFTRGRTPPPLTFTTTKHATTRRGWAAGMTWAVPTRDCGVRGELQRRSKAKRVRSQAKSRMITLLGRNRSVPSAPARRPTRQGETLGVLADFRNRRKGRSRRGQHSKAGFQKRAAPASRPRPCCLRRPRAQRAAVEEFRFAIQSESVPCACVTAGHCCAD